MSISWNKKPEAFAAVVGAVVAVLGMVWAIFVWWFPESPTSSESENQSTPVFFVVVTRSTRSLLEAKRFAVALSRRKYDVAIRFSPNGHYAVTVGKYRFHKANAVLNEGISTGYIPEDSYLVQDDWLLEEASYDGYDDRRYIHAGTYSTKERAFQYANELIAFGYDSEVYLTEDGFYAVTLGRFLEKRAIRLRVKAIDSGHIKEDSYLTMGNEYISKTKEIPLSNVMQPTSKPQCAFELADE